jgi:hypothetical protein
MREVQGKLKMAKRALESMMGEVYADNGYRAAQQDKRDFLRDNPGYVPEDPAGLKENLMFEGDDSILEHFHGATLEEGEMFAKHACLNNFKKHHVVVRTSWAKPSIKDARSLSTSQCVET